MKIKDEMTVRELSAAIVAIDIALDDSLEKFKKFRRRQRIKYFILFWQRTKRMMELQMRFAAIREFRRDLVKARDIFMNSEGRDYDMTPVTFRQMVNRIEQDG
jgi:hypothetical protein